MNIVTVYELIQLMESKQINQKELLKNGAQGVLVQAKLEQEWSSKTLTDFYDHFSKLFQCKKYALFLIEAHHSWVTLHAPLPVISFITLTAFEVIDELKAAGFLALKIGYLVVIHSDKRQDQKVINFLGTNCIDTVYSEILHSGHPSNLYT